MLQAMGRQEWHERPHFNLMNSAQHLVGPISAREGRAVCGGPKNSSLARLMYNMGWDALPDLRNLSRVVPFKKCRGIYVF